MLTPLLSLEFIDKIKQNQTPTALRMAEIDEDIYYYLSLDDLKTTVIEAFKTNTYTTCLRLIAPDEDLIATICSLIESAAGCVYRLKPLTSPSLHGLLPMIDMPLSSSVSVIPQPLRHATLLMLELLTRQQLPS